MDEVTRVLYLSYDGMTDALGQSQVLPYISGISKDGYAYTLVSCEKKERFEKGKSAIEKICLENNIQWIPIPYTKKPPIFSTIKDIYHLLRVSKKIYAQTPYKIVHCRGYIPAFVGLVLKKSYGISFIFDMRGFWADEKLDSGNWTLNHPLYRWIYRYFKRKEKDFFEHADVVVSLTEHGAQYIAENFNIDRKKIGVIPTCVDYANFYIQDASKIETTKNQLGIRSDETVFLYSGSLGTDSYDFQIVLKAFRAFQHIEKNAFLLILSKDQFQEQITLDDIRFRIIQSPFLEVNNYLNIADYAFVFYNQGWSNIGRSPTKLGEYLATGLHVMSYGTMGDVSILKENMNIFELKHLDVEDMREAISHFKQRHKTRTEIAYESHDYYDLKRGVTFYTNLYNHLQ